MSDTTRPDRIRVIADPGPGLHRTDSEELLWWLPILGPTASALAFLFARHATRAESCWPTEDLALTVRLWLPALTDRQLGRLPEAMAIAYRTPTQRQAS
jgi:hypothetical protein